MPDDPHSAAALRARLAHHQGVKSRAEADRAALIAERAEGGALLSDAELDAIDVEVARLGEVIERAGSRVALIGPALAAADRAEAEADDRGRSAALAEQDRNIVAGTAALLGGAEAAIVRVQLRAAATPVRPVNQKLFDEPPAPVMKRDDAAFWDAREQREREQRAARLAADMGQPAHAAPYR